MGDIYDTENRQWIPDGRHLVRQQDFWYVMGMTTWIVLPWICTREVPVDIELVSCLIVQITADTDTNLHVALSQGGHRPLPAWDATGIARTY